MRVKVAPGVWVLRAVTCAGILVGLLAGIPEGFVPSIPIVVVVALGGVLAGFRPDQLGASVTVGVVLVWWGVTLRHEVPVGCLAAAAGLVAAHVSCTLLAYGPPSMSVPGFLVRVWVMRGFLVWLTAPAIWLVARAYADRATPTSFWLAGLAAALAGAVVAALAVPERGVRRDG